MSDKQTPSTGASQNASSAANKPEAANANKATSANTNSSPQAKPVSSTTAANKPAAKKPAAKKPVAKKSVAKKAPAKRKATNTTARRTAAKKAPARRTTAKKTAAKRVSPSRTQSKTSANIKEAIMNKTNPQFDKIAQDAASAGKDQMEAVMKSGTLFMKGFENLFKTYVSFAQDTAEKNSEAVKKMMTCKTLNELTDAQNKLAQQNFDHFMSGSTKLSEMSVKVCTESLEPINDQLNKSIKKATETMAA